MCYYMSIITLNTSQTLVHLFIYIHLPEQFIYKALKAPTGSNWSGFAETKT